MSPCDAMSPGFRPGTSLFVTLGPRSSTEQSLHWGHIVVPPAISEIELQPGNWRRWRNHESEQRGNLLFLMATPNINPERKAIVESIQAATAYAASVGGLIDLR